MENSLEKEITEELERDKYINFYKKNKNKIIFFILFFLILIFGYQIRSFYYDKQNSGDIEKILLSQIYLGENNNKEGVDILNEVKKSNNETIVILSSNKLIDFYVKRNEMQKALNEIIFLKERLKNNSYSLELINIKEAIIKFDNIKENEILILLKKTNNEYFSSIKKQLIKQYYIKNNQFKKANMN